MKLRKLFTVPGDIALRFLLWREDLSEDNFFEFFLYYVLILPAMPAYLIMVIADLVEDFAEFYFPTRK